MSLTISFSKLAVLSRLLTPSDFGLFVAANAIIVIVSALNQALFAAPIVQRPPRENAAAIFTASLFFSVAAAALLAVLGAMLAVLAIETIAVPKAAAVTLLWLLPVIVFRGVAQVPLAILQTEHKFQTEVAVNTLSLLTGAAVTIALSFAGLGLQALIYGLWAEVILLAFCTALCTRPSISSKPAFINSIRLSKSFGIGYSMMILLNTSTQQATGLVLSHLQNPHFLGAVSRVQTLTEAIATGTGGAIINRLFRIFALLRHRPNALRAATCVAIELCMVISLPCSVALALHSQAIVQIVLGPQWFECGPAFAVLILTMSPRLTYKITEFSVYASKSASYSLPRTATICTITIVSLILAHPNSLQMVSTILLCLSLLNYALSAGLVVNLNGIQLRAFAGLHLGATALALLVLVTNFFVAKPITKGMFETEVARSTLSFVLTTLPALLAALLFPKKLFTLETREILMSLLIGKNTIIEH